MENGTILGAEFEYEFLPTKTDKGEHPLEELKKQLNEKGKDGWRLASVIKTTELEGVFNSEPYDVFLLSKEMLPLYTY